MDFVFISKEAPANQAEWQMMAPHIGPAWRTKETAAWLLIRGTIEWEDIPFGINCTCRLPPGYCREALVKVVAAWGAVEDSPSHGESKQSINSMIGLWSNSRQFSFQSRTHEPGMDDTIFDGAKVHRTLDEFKVEEMIMRFEQSSNSTMSVLHRQIMDAEHLHMARLAYYMRTMIPARHPKDGPKSQKPESQKLSLTKNIEPG